MFGGSRRRQPPAQPLTREPANPNATTAAAAVFMSRRDSTSSLSSAAAAAALRARPMTPTNVAEVQSKRASRRSPSISSLTGSVRERRELTRTPSVGSMMERTFRTPSPGRSPAPREHVPPVPPVPSVDQIMASHKTNGGQGKGSKSSALQTQPFRTASQKLKDGAQPSWFAGATTRDAKPRDADAAITSSPCVSDPRPGSVSPSINFSYPRATPLCPSPSGDEHTLVYDPNSRRMVTRTELLGHSQSARDGIEKPKMRKKSTVLDRTGSHLAKGTVGGRTTGPMLDEQPAQDRASQLAPELDISPQSTSVSAVASEALVEPPENIQQQQQRKKKKKKKKKKGKQKAEQWSTSTQTTAVSVDQHPLNNEQMIGRPPLSKKPSVVKEEPELEEVESPKGHGKQSDTVPMVAMENSSVSQSSIKTSDNKSEKQAHHIRIASDSSGRSAHFGCAPGDQRFFKHEPPARSVSPRKSALKLGGSNRGVSPSDDGSEASWGRGSSPHEYEATPVRKKSVRVSWDDRNTVVVGEAAQRQEADAPMIPSPQSKKTWHSVVSKFGRKENVTVAEDETMTPRPALPQFGSVREKKIKEPEERPLVRPSERTFTGEDGPASIAVGHSTDAVVGAIVSQDLASKNAANISKYREPLPPVLPPIENKKDPSAMAESSDDDFDTDATTEPEEGAQPAAVTQSSQITAVGPATSTENTPTQPRADGSVPIISVSQPTPLPACSFDASLPGSFPDDQVIPMDKTSSDDKSDESKTPAWIPAVEPIAAGAGVAAVVEEEEGAEVDRFSDAQEVPGEVDGDGFLSLDAVVESPVMTKITNIGKKKVNEKPGAAKATYQTKPTQSASSTAGGTNVLAPDDWENAKAYWKSLSIEKRRQLEIEALSETVEEAKTVDNGSVVTASGLSTERLSQNQPGTNWSKKISIEEKEEEEEEEEEDDDEAPEPETATVHPAKRASIVATKAKATAGTPIPKQRTSMRQSLRPESSSLATDVDLERPRGMRKSMRNGPITTTYAPGKRTAEAGASRPASALNPHTAYRPAMRQSLRASQWNGETLGPTLAGSGKTASYHHSPANGLAKSHRHTMSLDDLNSLASTRPTLLRRGSDDSESSFRRRRSGSALNDGHQFRMSMRSGLRGPPSSSEAAKRFSLRSLSPLGFRRNSFSSSSSIGGGPGRMRQPLRDRPVSSSGLQPGSSNKSPGFGRTSKGGSRFADSSDEEDVGTWRFQSRFVDSSDDEGPAPPPKRHGLPKSLRDGHGSPSYMSSRNVASPELPDEEDDLNQPKRGSPSDNQLALRRSRSGPGTLRPLSQNDYLPRPASRRGSLLSILRRKKDTSDKICKEVGESAARKDTGLERSVEELAHLRGNSLVGGGPSWPLPGDEGTDAENGGPPEPSRPCTAGGVAKSRKSNFLRRRGTSRGVVGLGHAEMDADEAVPPLPAELGQTGFQPQPQQARKKKFGALRKMFGIHD